MLILISFKNLSVDRILKRELFKCCEYHSPLHCMHKLCVGFLLVVLFVCFLHFKYASMWFSILLSFYPNKTGRENNAEGTYFSKYSNEVSGDSRSSIP